MKIMLATPFTSLPKNHDASDSRRRRASIEAYKRLLSVMRDAGHTVFCALEMCAWGKHLETPDTAVTTNWRELAEAGHLVAIPCGPDVSPGVCVEVGWAGGLGKHTTVLVPAGPIGAPFLIRGLHNLSHIALLDYQTTPDECAPSLLERLGVGDGPMPGPRVVPFSQE